ncbi:right-handed parallel beta-helix repeat-containing protein [Mesorhizobium muleiense]|uniref:right-handed parallel beta-helix repeat-containing protein n=1 Tax=Mesorhizobium muleiense TaxID=1004279 RepID=UPI003AFB2766
MNPTANSLKFVLVLFSTFALSTAASAQPVGRDLLPPPTDDEVIIVDGSTSCPRSTIDEVLESALDAQGNVKPGVADVVEIKCNLTLPAGAVVTKRLSMRGPGASGVTIDCKGATINGRHWLTLDPPRETIVVSGEQDESGAWQGAENITVRNCVVQGSVRVFGVAVSNSKLARMSYEPNYTQTLQASGSKNIVFEHMTITAYGRNPFYIMPGVTRVTLRDSIIGGQSNGVAIYLDAESAENVIKDNEIGVSNSREQFAIDGSARNLIVGNRFSGLNNGGIYLYRNCGERGVIRHQGPEDNVIIDNVFYYDRYRGDTPAVWIASRQNDLPGYCDEDEGSEVPNVGSSLDHLDHAKRAVVARNRFVARNPTELIRVHDDPSYVFDNAMVADADDRYSPCYVANGYPDPILESGERLALFDNGSGPGCTGRQLICTDGIITQGFARCLSATPSVSVVPFQCRAEGSNGGCSGQTACPGGTSLASVKAACNLEFGAVGDTEMALTPWSLAGIVKRSDNRGEGECELGSIDVGESGAQLTALNDAFDFSCEERDGNGGDCHVRGELACQPTLPVLR